MRGFHGIGLLATLIALAAAPAAEAGFGCAASAGRVSVLGQKAVEPVSVGGGGDCAGETQSLGAGALPDPVDARAVVAATQVYSAQKAVLASGGVSDLTVRALPTLPIALPKVTIPSQLSTLSVDITAVKNLLDPLHLNPVVTALPSTVTVDARAAVQSLLPDGKLPNAELLHITGAMAYAVGSCQSGGPTVGGESRVAGISILGADVLGDAVDRTVSLINSASIDPSQANVAAIDLGLPSAVNTLIAALPAAQAAVAAAIQNALDALPDLKVLDPTLAQIKVTPGLQVKDATSVTQQALNVSVTIAGQKIVDAVIGEARASATNVDCSDPVTDPKTPTGATLQCSTRKLVLVDVLERAGRVRLFGVADPALAGRTVAIVFAATHRVVAHAKVDKSGQFTTTAPLPPPSVRNSNRARYTAVLGRERSINLKLRRRMVITSMTARHGRVTIVGRVLPPLARPVKAITLTRRTSCRTEKVVTVFHPRANGDFRISVKAPKSGGTAVYRLTTLVRNSFQGTGVFETFTLPRAVDLQ